MTGRPPKLTEQDIAALAATVEAPEALHRRVNEMVAEAQRRAPARRRTGWTMPARRLAVAGAAALAVVGAVLAVSLSGGTGGGALTPQAAAMLALGRATSPAPSERANNRSELTASVDGVSFPYWKERFGWRGVGTRSDTIAGRNITTVFYANGDGRRIGYAIASGRAPQTEGGTVVRRWGVSYRVLEQDGATVVTWQRNGHLCVMAGRGVSAHTLVNLASWRA